MSLDPFSRAYVVKHKLVRLPMVVWDRYNEVISQLRLVLVTDQFLYFSITKPEPKNN